MFQFSRQITGADWKALNEHFVLPPNLWFHKGLIRDEVNRVDFVGVDELMGWTAWSPSLCGRRKSGRSTGSMVGPTWDKGKLDRSRLISSVQPMKPEPVDASRAPSRNQGRAGRSDHFDRKPHA
jgi:hypothetical protein